MDAALRLSKLIDSLNRVIARAMGWALFLMVLVGAYNAIARSLEKGLGLSLSSNAYIEAQWYLFSLVFLLGAPYALRSNAHVRVDVLYGEHPARGKAWTDLIGGVLFLIPFCLFAIWISWDFVSNSIAVGELSPDPGGLPRWPLKLVVPISFALLCLQGASEVVKRAALLCGRGADDVGLEEPSLVDRSAEGES